MTKSLVLLPYTNCSSSAHSMHRYTATTTMLYTVGIALHRFFFRVHVTPDPHLRHHGGIPRPSCRSRLCLRSPPPPPPVRRLPTRSSSSASTSTSTILFVVAFHCLLRDERAEPLDLPLEQRLLLVAEFVIPVGESRAFLRTLLWSDLLQRPPPPPPDEDATVLLRSAFAGGRSLSEGGEIWNWLEVLIRVVVLILQWKRRPQIMLTQHKVLIELTCIMTVCRKMPGFGEVPFAKLYSTIHTRFLPLSFLRAEWVRGSDDFLAKVFRPK